MGPSRDEEAIAAIFRRIAGKVAPAEDDELMEAGRKTVEDAADRLRSFGVVIGEDGRKPYQWTIGVSPLGEHVYFGYGRKGVSVGTGGQISSGPPTQLRLQYDRPSKSFIGEDLDEDGRAKSGARVLAEALERLIFGAPVDS